MAGTAITDFTEEVDHYLKGADKSENKTFIDDMILKTVRDFTKATWIFRQTLTKIDVVENDHDYTLAPAVTNCDSPEVHKLDWVKYKEDGNDDDEFAFLNAWNIETEEVNTSTGISAGYINVTGDAPEVYWLEPDDTLQIRPIPNANAAGTANMQVKAILSPKLDATTVPTFLYDDWLETIAVGVASRVMNMSGEKWYNAELGRFYRGQYKQARNDEARAQIWQGRVRKQGHIRFNTAFTGGNRQRNWIF